MAFCCENTRKAYELIGNAKSKLNWRPEGPGFSDIVGGILTLNTSTGVKLSGYLERAINEMIGAFKILNQAQNAIKSCNCGSNLSYWKGEEWKERERANSLMEKYDDLFRKFGDLDDDKEELKERYESMRNDREREKINNVRDTTKLQGELETASYRIDSLTKQLEDSRKELGLVRIEKNNEVERLEIKLDEESNQLIALRTENIKKGEELRRKDKEIERLKNRAELSQEELLVEKLSSEKKSLELFATELRINLEQISNLSKYHERLFQARKNHNRANITTHEDNITRIKQELQNTGISIVNIQEICEKCQRIAKFSFELDQVQQQYEAHQEIPTT